MTDHGSQDFDRSTERRRTHMDPKKRGNSGKVRHSKLRPNRRGKSIAITRDQVKKAFDLVEGDG